MTNFLIWLAVVPKLVDAIKYIVDVFKAANTNETIDQMRERKKKAKKVKK